MTYALVAVASIGAVLATLNTFVELGVHSLAAQRIEGELQELAHTTSQMWSKEGGWRQADLDQFGMEALAKGYLLRLDLGAGGVIWDIRTHNAGLCVAMLDHMQELMGDHGGSGSRGYQERSFPLKFGELETGVLNVGLYGPVFFNATEASFIEVLKQRILGIGLLVLLLSLLLGWSMARWMSRPLAAVTEAARRFRYGQWDHPPQPKTSITELVDLWASIRALGESLQAQESLRRRLTADVSHELRAPLTIVQARLEAMIDGIQVPTLAILENLRQEILRLTRLVEQLEQLTQADQPKMNVVLSPLHSQSFLEPLTQPLGVQLVGDDVEFTADADLTRQILVNLMTNAVKYTPPPGTVTIQVWKRKAEVEFAVSDTGIGIASEHLPFLFERFYRVDSSRTRATGGAGLGLSIAQSLAIAQGGRITVESVLGKGSTFHLFLPQSHG